MKKSKNTESDLGDTSTPEKQPKENMEDVLRKMFATSSSVVIWLKLVLRVCDGGALAPHDGSSFQESAVLRSFDSVLL
ncbi:hypothetical protein Tco_0236669 [Tanacetum coccineum]